MITTMGFDKTKQIKADAIHTSPISTAHYGLMNDKISRTIIEYEPTISEIDNKPGLIWAVDQGKAKSNNQVISYIALYYDDNNRIIIAEDKITGMDEAVLTTVSNMIHNQKDSYTKPPYYFTPEDIWRSMNGINGKGSPTKNQKQKVCESIEKMMALTACIYINEELKSGYFKTEDPLISEKGFIKGPLLKCEKAFFRSEKGKELCGYVFDDIPLLFSYNAAKNHVYYVDADLLNTSDTGGITENIIEFRNALLLEIQLRYSHIKNSNRIRIKTLYQYCSIPPPSERISRSNYRNEHSYNTTVKQLEREDLNKITAILDSWVKKQWILGFKLVKEGKDYTAIDFQFNPENYTNRQIRRKSDND